MAVYTKLTKEEIKNFIAENYAIGELVSFKEIIDGIDNSNFIIECQKDGQVAKYIFTIFEKRIKKDELPFFMELKKHLAKNGICCPESIFNNSQNLISNIKSKSASIVTFLVGKTLKPQKNGLYKDIAVDHCFQIGEVAAKLHKASKGFAMNRNNDLGIWGWRPLFKKIHKEIASYQEGLDVEIKNYIARHSQKV